jgi:hypothetical protein
MWSRRYAGMRLFGTHAACLVGSQDQFSGMSRPAAGGPIVELDMRAHDRPVASALPHGLRRKLGKKRPAG